MEIGSEFWLEDLKNTNQNWKVNNNEVLLMSGRTAIDLAINLINIHKKIKRVYMPSYCCESMLIPFIKKDICIEFYEVTFKEGKLIYNIDTNKDCNVFFAMNYFGFSSCNMDEYIEKFKERNIIVIEDSTHSFLSKRKYNSKSDIVIASLRKWFPIISGAILIVNNVNFIDNMKNLKNNLNQNNEYNILKEKAMLEKAKYIKNKEHADKSNFLSIFKQADAILKSNFKNYEIDNKSKEILKKLNINQIIVTRRENAKEIYDFLKVQNEIEYLKEINFKEDTPLFVPIFLEEEKRDKLKQYLVQNNIYCPIHWQMPNLINRGKEIYAKELSLICDQRYSKKDIQNYIKLINIKNLIRD